MIVKLGDGCGGWVFLEAKRVEVVSRGHQALRNTTDKKTGLTRTDLFRVTKWKGSKPEFDEGDLHFDEVHMSVSGFEKLQEKDAYILVTILRLVSEEGRHRSHAVVGDVFLMNDNGKTIERL